MKIIEKLSCYDEKIVIIVKVKNHKNHIKTKDEIAMDKHLLAKRLENCIKINNNNKREMF